MKTVVALTVFLFCALLPPFGVAKVVTNTFGISYDTEKKEFNFAAKIVNLRQLTPKERQEGYATISVGTPSIKRINKHYYAFTDTIDLNNQGQERRFVAYKAPVQGEPGQFRYFAVLGSMTRPLEEVNVKAEGKFLTVSEGVAQAQGVLHYGGRLPAKISPYEISPECLYQISSDEYLVVWDGLRLLMTTPVLFADVKTNQVKIIPLTFVYAVWNEYAFGIRVDPGRCDFFLVNLRNGKELAIDGQGGLLMRAYLFDENHILLELITGEQRLLRYGKMTKLDARYLKAKNLMLEYKGNRLTRILTQNGSVLWSGSLDEDAILKIDLDQDLHNEMEALVLKLKDHALLIDCISGEAHEADAISHVGLGFFRLEKDGMDNWLTL